MITYNMRYRGQYEYDKFALNIIQFINLVSEITKRIDQETDSDIIGYKKELDSIFYQLDDLNLELSKQKERYSI